MAWTPIAGRQAEVAAALGGEPAVFFWLGDAPKWTVPVRYAVSALQTALYLARRRPRAVIVTNPPVVAALPVLAYGRLTGAAVLLDSHPGGFGLQGDRLSARLQFLHRRLVPRARATLVTEAELAARVTQWGGRAEVLHEAPPAWAPPPPATGSGRWTALFVCVFQRDEPVAEVLEAARRLPHARVRITGDLRRRAPELTAAAPPNVEWTGFLDPEAYRQALFSADAVLVLTTEPTSVVRGGYEAVWAHRPLVVSDSPALRAAFPDAVHVANDAAAIAGGLATARERQAQLAAAAPEARDRQLRRWEDQRDVLETLLGDRP